MDEKETIQSDVKAENRPRNSMRNLALAVGGTVGVWAGCAVNRRCALPPHASGAR